jgi:hypothetical protein
MDSEAFRKYGKEMVDIVADYWDSLEGRSALPDVKPGYIWDLIPKTAPAEGKSSEKIGPSSRDWKRILTLKARNGMEYSQTWRRSYSVSAETHPVPS